MMYFWVVPGGGIEFGEFSIEAGIREVAEETGIEAEITHLLWVVEERKPDNSVDYVHYFLGRVIGGHLEVGTDPELPNDEQVLLDAAFFHQHEIQNMSRVYPETLQNEFWELLSHLPQHGLYRIRPCMGFN